MADMSESRCIILAVNPGNTSTKVGLFEISGEGNSPRIVPMEEENLVHDDDDLAGFATVPDQLEFRLEAVCEFLSTNAVPISGVVGRGGLLRPVPGGTYPTSESLLEDLRTGFGGHHASNLGGLLAAAIAEERDIPSFVVDPVSVDELHPVARISGLPEIQRISLWHALNCKATARETAHRMGKQLQESNFVVVHLGSGITVAAMEGGRAVDVNNAVAEGPFGADRAGGLPATSLVDLATDGTSTPAELKRRLMGGGGLFAYLGTRDTRAVEARADEGDERAALVLDAMTYQIGKETAAMASVLRGNVDAIVLTGGMARSRRITEAIIDRVGWIAPVTLLPGEDELNALALGAYRVLVGTERPAVYPGGEGEEE